MPDKIVLPRRFNGPPDSANGGYTCGRVADFLGGEAEITLRKPPPLETPLELSHEGDTVVLRDGGETVAEAVATEVDVEIPEPVSMEEAAEARKRYHGFRHHAYPTCFTCGPDRADGLGIFPGPVVGREGVAASWLPAPGETDPEIVWAALDCPSGWAVDDFGRRGVLLGRMAAKLLAPVEVGEPYVVLGWRIGEDGRKRFAGSALFDAGGALVAFARSTWLVPRAG